MSDLREFTSELADVAPSVSGSSYSRPMPSPIQTCEDQVAMQMECFCWEARGIFCLGLVSDVSKQQRQNLPLNSYVQSSLSAMLDAGRGS